MKARAAGTVVSTSVTLRNKPDSTFGSGFIFSLENKVGVKLIIFLPLLIIKYNDKVICKNSSYDIERKRNYFYLKR